jgi:hypothetical protein
MIDLCCPLAVLAQRLPWDRIEASLRPRFEHEDRAGEPAESVDIVGPNSERIAGCGNAGRPRLSFRLVASLVYPKHSFNLSDEEVCQPGRSRPPRV